MLIHGWELPTYTTKIEPSQILMIPQYFLDLKKIYSDYQ